MSDPKRENQPAPERRDTTTPSRRIRESVDKPNIFERDPKDPPTDFKGPGKKDEPKK